MKIKLRDIANYLKKPTEPLKNVEARFTYMKKHRPKMLDLIKLGWVEYLKRIERWEMNIKK